MTATMNIAFEERIWSICNARLRPPFRRRQIDAGINSASLVGAFGAAGRSRLEPRFSVAKSLGRRDVQRGASEHRFGSAPRGLVADAHPAALSVKARRTWRRCPAPHHRSRCHPRNRSGRARYGDACNDPKTASGQRLGSRYSVRRVTPMPAVRAHAPIAA